MPTFREMLATAKANIREISTEHAEVEISRAGTVILDVREPDEYAAGHVTNSRNVPFDQLEAKLSNTVKNKSLPVLLMCATGARAGRALAIAKKLGYEQAQVVGGGLKGWKDANLPIEKA